MVQVGEIHYYERPGPRNTDDVINAAARRARHLGIRQVVVATSHGRSALTARAAFDPEVRVIAVTHSASYYREGWTPTEEERRRMLDAGLEIVTTTHALANDVSEAMGGGGLAPNRIACDMLCCFSQGMKVAVEVSVMAAEAGRLDMGSDAIAIGGTGAGADTAIVVRPAYAREFARLKIREVIGMPR
ncbi:MAG: hypothetical protein HPY83_12175 [Anaerolineae bacterium]|nr:hypothetical protein [Anaerolineae bacterium]